jgi:hypothetical protein
LSAVCAARRLAGGDGEESYEVEHFGDVVEPQFIGGDSGLGRRGLRLRGAIMRIRIVIEPVAEPLNWKVAARVTRGRPSAVLRVHGSSRLARHRPAARTEPSLKIAFENADAPFRELDRGGPDTFGDLPLQRSPRYVSAFRRFVVTENYFHVDADLFVACREKDAHPQILKARSLFVRTTSCRK